MSSSPELKENQSNAVELSVTTTLPDLLTPQSKLKKRTQSQVFREMRRITQPLTFPKIAPEKAVSMYASSVSNQRNTIEPPVYRGDTISGISDDLCIAWRIEKERDTWLRSERSFTVSRREAMDKQWRALKKREIEFRSAFKKFNKFVKENEEKRQRAKQKIIYFKKMSALRDNEIQALEEKRQNALNVKEKMEIKIREFAMYEDYLNNVVVISKNEFRHPQDIISRYEALLEAKSVIKSVQEESYQKLEDAHMKFRKLREDVRLKMIGLMNIVNGSMQRYEHAKFSAMKWESIVCLLYVYIAEMRTVVLRSKDACLNVYKDCCKRKNIQHVVDNDDTKAQLILIKKTLKDLADITALFKLQVAQSILL